MADDPESKQVEEVFRHKLFRGKTINPAAIAEYGRLPDTDRGKLLDTDLARWLCPEYFANVEGRKRFTTATHQPATDFIQQLYEQKLAQEPSGPVILLAGGGGSGKSSVARGPLHDTLEDAEIIVDGTCSNYDRTLKRMDQALATGRPVLVVYIHRRFTDAVQGVFVRYQKTGRSVPPRRLALDHAGAQDTFARLVQLYADNKRVRFWLWDNSGAEDAAVELPIAQFDALRYDQQSEGVEATAWKLLPYAEEVLRYAP